MEIWPAKMRRGQTWVLHGCRSEDGVCGDEVGFMMELWGWGRDRNWAEM